MKKLIICFIIAALVFASCTRKSETETDGTDEIQTVSIGGSTSVTPLMELFQADYEKANENIKLTISGTGSGDGIKGAAEGTYDIGMSSRSLTPVEIGSGLDWSVVAIDGIAVVLNNNNPIGNLSLTQIQDIYTGKITAWEQLGADSNGKTGGIAVVSREPGSGTRGAFQELVNFSDSELKSEAIIFDGTGAIKSAVAGNEDAIGYISLGSVDSTIKALAVDGVNPTNDNVKNGSYLIARPFILITKQGVPLKAAAQAFMEWTFSEAGQNIVRRSWISID